MRVKTYSEEEKMAYVEEFKNSGMGSTTFAREKGIPESTLRTWIREDRNLEFGAIEIGAPKINTAEVLKKKTVFANENIRIELKEGFNKEFLRKIVEVLINDK